MGEGWIGAADVRFDLVDAADQVLGVLRLEKGTSMDNMVTVRFYPEPAVAANMLEDVSAVQFLPTFEVGGRCLQVPTKALTAATAHQALSLCCCWGGG